MNLVFYNNAWAVQVDNFSGAAVARLDSGSRAAAMMMVTIPEHTGTRTTTITDPTLRPFEGGCTAPGCHYLRLQVQTNQVLPISAQDVCQCNADPTAVVHFAVASCMIAFAAGNLQPLKHCCRVHLLMPHAPSAAVGTVPPLLTVEWPSVCPDGRRPSKHGPQSRRTGGAVNAASLDREGPQPPPGILTAEHFSPYTLNPYRCCLI